MEPKLKFIISDLHLGAGREGNYLEDFTLDSYFASFLKEISHEARTQGCEVELIINGDFFEFLQVPAVDDFDPHTTYPAQAYLDSSEPASIKRLNLIVSGHQEVFNALTDFMHVEPPRRRLTIIKGNHDVNLYWPRVKSRLREVLGASGTRASLLLFADEFVKREHLYAEHGHQRAEKMNAYHDFLDPHHPGEPTQLFYPAGSRYVANFFNEIEQDRWFVDSIKPLTSLIWYALHWDFDFAADALVHFVRHTAGLVVSNLDADKRVRLPENSILHQLEDPDRRPQAKQRYQTDIVFRERLHLEMQRYFSDAHVTNKPDTGSFPGIPLNNNPLVMARAEQMHQQTALQSAAEAVARQEGAHVIMFGHSHHPVHTQLEHGATYINTGCWLGQHNLTDASHAVWEMLFRDASNYAPAPLRLPYARIEYDEAGLPSPYLMDFVTKRLYYDT